VPHLRVFFPDICLTTEEKAGKTLGQGEKNLSQSTVYTLPTHARAHMPTHARTRTIHARPLPQTGHWSDHIFYSVRLCIQLMAGNADEAAVVYAICDKWTRLRQQAQISHPQPKDRCRISKKLNALVVN
jgi:hypothetical protein